MRGVNYLAGISLGKALRLFGQGRLKFSNCIRSEFADAAIESRRTFLVLDILSEESTYQNNCTDKEEYKQDYHRHEKSGGDPIKNV